MNSVEAHPATSRLSAYIQGRLDEPVMDEIERHLFSCDSCCRWIREQPEDSLVAKLRGRGAATVGKAESAFRPKPGPQVRSSFAHDHDVKANVHQAQPIFASLPGDLNDHPRYRIVDALGSGGMGTVYRAEHRLMDRTVALKVIRGDLLGNPALVERFRREVKSAARLASHPNIVAAYDAEQAGETHILVVEFVEGTDLARLVDRRGPLPAGEACEYARQAAVGLQHAFEDEMVHRDIKPQNLMRTTRGQVKILDFGLARFASEVGSQAGVTAEGMVLGSADYIAPEQIEDPHAADIRADIYSLGCTLYFLLAGRPPFPDRGLIQKLIAHRENTPRPIGGFRGDIPPDLAHVVERMMATDPAARFQTPEEVARALAPFAERQIATTALDAPALAGSRALLATSPSIDSVVGEQKPSKSQPTRLGSHPRRPWVWIAAVVASLPIMAMALALILSQLMSIRTPTGELFIESEDPNIKVIVKEGGQQVTIVDPKTSNRIELNAGRYELQLASGGPGLKLSTDTFTLRRGEKTVVTVRRQPPAPAAQPGPQPYREHHKFVVTSPKARDIIITLPFVGNIQAHRHIDVRSPEKGYVEAIVVRAGQVVKKDDPMFKLVSTLDKDPAKKSELTFTNVRAPFDGIVGRQLRQVGSLVMEADILTTLSDNSVMWVYFNAPERYYLEYMAHQKEHEKEDRIELMLANGDLFPQTGTIGAIEADFNSKTGNIPFRADFPNPDGLLRHGQTGTIKIRRPLKDALVIPQKATFERLDKRCVWVIGEDHVAHQTLITVKHELEDVFVIGSGLDARDKIVVEGVRDVSDGEKVEYEFRHPEQVMEKQ